MISFIFGVVWFFIKAVVFLGLITIFYGCIRLICGFFYKYDKPLKDTSSLKKGDIILTGKQSIFSSWYIQISNVLTGRLEHRFWTHAAIYKGNGKVWEAQREGIIETDISKYTQGGFMMRAFRHRYLSDEAAIDSVLNFCDEANKEGYEYGTFGAGFYALSTFVPITCNFLFDNKFVNKKCSMDNAYFCSELIVDAFGKADFPISPYKGWRVKPADFITNPFLKPID